MISYWGPHSSTCPGYWVILFIAFSKHIQFYPWVVTGVTHHGSICPGYCILFINYISKSISNFTHDKFLGSPWKQLYLALCYFIHYIFKRIYNFTHDKFLGSPWKQLYLALCYFIHYIFKSISNFTHDKLLGSLWKHLSWVLYYFINHISKSISNFTHDNYSKIFTSQKFLNWLKYFVLPWFLLFQMPLIKVEHLIQISSIKYNSLYVKPWSHRTLRLNQVQEVMKIWWTWSKVLICGQFWLGSAL